MVLQHSLSALCVLNCICSKLSTHLPHKVDHERGKAKWDSSKKQLRVVLPIIKDDTL
jgi:hypothetical protein